MRISVFAIGLLAASLSSVDAQGYRLTASQVVVNSQQHWQDWTFADGTLQFAPDGSVRVRKLQGNTNAVLDIVESMQLHPPSSVANKEPEEIELVDAVQAVSNRSGVVRTLDGDLSTFWEPDPADPDRKIGEQWWFILDMGRLVFADRIVLEFVGEELGDPFLLFDVLVSDGLKPVKVQGSPLPEFKTVFRLLTPNTDQRRFEIDLSTLSDVDPELAAEGVRFVQVIITGSNGERGKEVTQEQYATLSAQNQGAVDYFKTLSGGGELLIDREFYELLDPSQRGDVRYYRRERPRLAELQVWNKGDEILSGTLERGGFAESPKMTLNLTGFIDGNLESFSQPFTGTNSPPAELDRMIIFDMGSFYWVDTHRLAYGGLSKCGFGDYNVELSNGSLAADGSLQWVNAFPETQMAGCARRFEGGAFDPVAARFFRLRWVLAPRTTKADLAEIQLYGEGYQPRVALESPLIRLSGSRNLLSMEWEAETPSGTDVLIQTRTGDELGEVLRYFHKNGTEVTEKQHGRLLSIFKGDVVGEQVPGSDWSDWSEPYANPEGSPVLSPSPREFLIIRVVMVSENPDTTATLRSLRLQFSDPVASQVVGEIFPFQVDSLGVERVFSLFLSPRFGSSDAGFDEILLVAPEDMSMTFESLHAGSEGDFADEDGSPEALSTSVAAEGGDSLRISFPSVGSRSGIEILRLDFRTALFSTGAPLRAAVQRGAQAGWQRVDAGDALKAVEGNTTTLVGVTGRDHLITNTSVSLALTPNGDGINDEAVVSFNVVRVGDGSPVEVGVFNLSGRRVRTLREQRGVSTGSYRVTWDGLDSGGELPPPGLYILSVEIVTDTDGARLDDTRLLKTISLVY
ncbi:MAG: hypothetical protein VX733_14310 [Candidatus Latescibacterota bacterium]|nr:hypothetical protein [Candidatus Latescibacterota bacterium]